MLNLKAILIALSGVLVVGGIGTYVVLENRKSQETPVEVSAPATTDQAVKDESASTATDAASTQTQTDEVATTTEQEQVTSEPTSPTADWVMPAFDLLRVEPDGSTVIAGRGQPNTSLKIMNGDEMIAEAEVGASGDFVVIFDEALNSGDYQLSLKVEDENGLSVTSEETAIVSVPEDESGQLLAMVQKPGEASRIITQPEVAPNEAASASGSNSATMTAEGTSEKPTVPTTQVAENEVSAEEAGDTATETTSETATEEKSVEVAVNDANEETSSAANIEATGTEATGTETMVADAKDAVANVMEKATKSVAETAEKVMDKATDEAAETAEKVMEKTDDAVETAKAAVDTIVEKAVEETENTVAALASDANESTDTPSVAAEKQDQPVEEKMETKAEEPVVEKPVIEKPKAPSETVRIEAVEVEGDKLFVAGSGTAGYQVRVFADGEEVGIANVESNGRFIIEATKDLEVGQHKITAALEDKQTNQVILRAIVPFNRPEGQALAAVASNDDTSSMDKPVESTETETAMVKEEPKAAETETASAAATETQTTTSEIASNDASATMTKEEEMVKSEETMANENTSTSSSDTATATETAPESAGETASSEEEASVTASSDNQTTEPKTIVQDELQPASSQSVIIRRGDTLWQIARRTYGAGVRYTTIYLANQQQIDNPDRIAPGQIFEVPEEALENAEQLHRQRLGLE